MLEITKKIKSVKIEGVMYEMKMPTYKDSLAYDAEVTECGDDSAKKADALFSYLASLGLPKEVAIGLEVEAITAVVSYLAGEKKS